MSIAAWPTRRGHAAITGTRKSRSLPDDAASEATVQGVGADILEARPAEAEEAMNTPLRGLLERLASACQIEADHSDYIGPEDWAEMAAEARAMAKSLDTDDSEGKLLVVCHPLNLACPGGRHLHTMDESPGTLQAKEPFVNAPNTVTFPLSAVLEEETGPRVVASYCPELACRRVGSVHFVNSACKEVFPGWPWDLSRCPGVLQAAVSRAEWETMRAERDDAVEFAYGDKMAPSYASLRAEVERLRKETR